jgi:hypothetical protein
LQFPLQPLTPQGGAHPVARVLYLGGGHVGVALGRWLGVTESITLLADGRLGCEEWCGC